MSKITIKPPKKKAASKPAGQLMFYQKLYSEVVKFYKELYEKAPFYNSARYKDCMKSRTSVLFCILKIGGPITRTRYNQVINNIHVFLPEFVWDNEVDWFGKFSFGTLDGSKKFTPSTAKEVLASTENIYKDFFSEQRELIDKKVFVKNKKK